MNHDPLEQEVLSEITNIRFMDVHSHVDPRQPTANSLDDLLGYHYYTELAHSAGMDKSVLAAEVNPLERVRTILAHAERFGNTIQYSWFTEIAQTFLDFPGATVTAEDAEPLWQAAKNTFGRADWESRVIERTNVDRIFLTNCFDEDLEGFDARRYVPCLRTDDLTFQIDQPEVRDRLAKVTGMAAGNAKGLRWALRTLFEHFAQCGAKACAISLPPSFAPQPVSENDLDEALAGNGRDAATLRSQGVFWLLAELCREFKLPFALMIGVNRGVYAGGVHQGQDLFDHRASLIPYRRLFNGFPEVTFCVSVLASNLNQELASHGWIFPNVVASGHWWYSNLPALIEHDARVRLQGVPQTKQLGYYSDAYKVEFILPKFNTYRRVLARILANDFMRDRGWTLSQVTALARRLLRENAIEIFKLG